ncbi:MAG: flagellin, partial [Armatimonadota bacterium]
NLNNVIAVRSQMGGRLNRLESTNNMLLDLKLSMSNLLSETEDADLAEAILDLRTQENVYQAAAATAGRVLDISLVNYLK